ncbi:Lrp/AsnC family transcriptional regulator [Salinibaculum salinum]|uniref:Lrp/AsnC family transcriptional regulator n=1 Tax=Salinibaculum salinum TaxID=3131996 RepID=UPI0030EDF9F2
MEPPALDNVDRGILHMLQDNARSNSARDIADAIGVSPNTVRNRIEKLEANGVIQGYHPQINYEQAGFQLQVVFVCTTPVTDQSDLADQVFDIPGVIEIHEILSGHDNLTVRAVGHDSDDLTQIATTLEDLGLTITDERFLKNTRVRPFNHFGVEEIEE